MIVSDATGAGHETRAFSFGGDAIVFDALTLHPSECFPFIASHFFRVPLFFSVQQRACPRDPWPHTVVRGMALGAIRRVRYLGTEFIQTLIHILSGLRRP